MPREKYTDFTIILDRSGSMEPIKPGTIAGVNSFIKEQKELPGDGCWTLIQFDDQYEVHYAGTPMDKVPLLNDATYQPRGWTALIDAVCRTIHETIARLAGLTDEQYPSEVIFVIMTDGLNNASKLFKKADMKALIDTQREKYNWQFLFLAANQDAITEAETHGITRDGALNYAPTSDGAEWAWKDGSAGVGHYRGLSAGEKLTSGGVVVTATPGSPVWKDVKPEDKLKEDESKK